MKPTTFSAPWLTGAPGPGRRGQRRPRSAATGVRRSGRGQGALPGPRAGEGDDVRARQKSPKPYGVPVDRAGPAYAELALLRGDPSDGLPGVPGVGEKTAATLLAQHGSLEAHPGRRARPEIEDVQGVSDEAAGRHRLHRGGRRRWCAWPPMPTSTSPRRRTRCRWPPSTRARSPNSPNSTALRPRSGDCRRRSTDCRLATRGYFGRPTS